jgi:predicted transcriptional regulator
VPERQTSGDNSQLWRMKSAMVLYELERTLGDFVCSEASSVADLSSKTLHDIKDREVKSTGAFDDSTPARVVAATYLAEVFGLAQGVAKGRPEEKYLLTLRQLFDALDVFSIRNAISHPNRSFHPSYWYRVAAIATDPLVDKLQFRKVTRAFIDAEEGRLASPPGTWMSAPIWSLPGNLPEQFDHDITGLVARQREVDELNKLIRNGRLNLIAIVAPGGTGKTALLLHALYEIVHSPQSTEWVDRILYFSSKTEFLTSEGIVSNNPSTSNIDGIRSSIAKTLEEQNGLDSLSFEDACREFQSERILLCLDNLETILRDEPEQFEIFYRDLPREWRVIVTSRVSVNSATIMPLNALTFAGAKALAWNYLSKRGSERISEDELEVLVKTCDMNPLAIRLTIDGFIAGIKPLSEMQNLAKQQVIDFSYRNLIDALSPTVHELLECLFVESEPVSRTTACNLLKKNLDEISEAFSRVRGTSLVTRTPGQAEERYTLSSSIRDFLIVRPINLDARKAVQEELRKMKLLVSEIAKSQQNLNPLEREYIPESAPDEVKVVAADALKVWKRQSSTTKQLFDEIGRVRQAIDRQDHSLLHRVLGLISIRLNDRSTGKQELRLAFEMIPTDVSAGSVLASELRKDQELQEAHRIAKELFETGWCNPALSSPFNASLLLKNYYLPLIWMGEVEQVIEDTDDWKTHDAVRGILGTIRAMAFRQSVESERNSDLIQNAYCRAIEVLNEVFNLDGYAIEQVSEGIKLIEQLAYTVRRGSQSLTEASKIIFTRFVDEHLFLLTEIHKTNTLDNPEVIRWIQEMSELLIKGGNPLIADRWQRLVKSPVSKNSLRTTDETEEEWIEVVISRRARHNNGDYKPFLFARDSYKKEYFIYRSTLEFEVRLWNDLQVGDRLEIIPESYPPEEGKYQRATASKFVQ